MRFVGGLGCQLVALECAIKAVSAEQTFFGPDFVWVWWVIALCWVFSGLEIWFAGYAE